MKLASLFDGSGGFPLAAIRAGITPVWASEIEPFAIAVTRQNIPSMARRLDSIRGGFRETREERQRGFEVDERAI